MKSLSIAMFCLFATSNAFAETAYQHEYENGGYFEKVEETINVTEPANVSNVKHVYLNDGHFGDYVYES